jgi:hypothetical protein
MTGVNATDNMAGFAFTGTWHATDSYPRLAWEDTDPFYEVDTLETNEPVVEGETVSVTATVTNSGADGGPQQITLTDTDFENQQRDSLQLTLASGASDESVELEWTTSDGDADAGDVTVESENDTATRTVTVQEAPSFAVEITGTTSPVVPGETMTVTANVTNTGDVEGTQSVTLTDTGFDSAQRDAVDVTLAGGESTNSVMLEWQTTESDIGSGAITVESKDQSSTDTVSVVGRGPDVTDLAVDIDSPTLTPGASTNGTATATFEDGSTVDVTPGALLYATNTTVATVDDGTITAQTPGMTTLTAIYSTYGGTVRASESLRVEATSDIDLAVQNVTAAEPVIAGVEQPVTATITNTGNQPVDRTVELRIDQNRTAATIDLDLTPGESRTVELAYTPRVTGIAQRNLTVDVGMAQGTTMVTVDIRVITYTNDADIAHTDGLRDAIRDWRADYIETDLLRDVITAWRHGNPVT